MSGEAFDVSHAVTRIGHTSHRCDNSPLLDDFRAGKTTEHELLQQLLPLMDAPASFADFVDMCGLVR